MAVARSPACRPGRRTYSGKLGGNASPRPLRPTRPRGGTGVSMGGVQSPTHSPISIADPTAILAPADAYIASGAAALDGCMIVLALWRSQSPLSRHRRRDDPDPETLHPVGGR